MSKRVDVRETIEKNTSKTIKAVIAKYFLTCVDNILAESIQMNTALGKVITRNQLMGTEQPAQILLTTT